MDSFETAAIVYKLFKQLERQNPNLQCTLRILESYIEYLQRI